MAQSFFLRVILEFFYWVPNPKTPMAPHLITLITKNPNPKNPIQDPYPKTLTPKPPHMSKNKKCTKRINPGKIIIFITLNSLQYGTKEQEYLR